MKQKLTEQQKASIEYNRRLAKGEYKIPEVLKDKKVLDVLDMDIFKTNMAAYINEQKMARAAVIKTRADIKASGKYVARENRPCIDRVIELGLMESVDDFTFAFAQVLTKESQQPRAIREYVQQLGMLAYQLTIEQLICEANPDLAELVKKAKETTKN